MAKFKTLKNILLSLGLLAGGATLARAQCANTPTEWLGRTYGAGQQTILAVGPGDSEFRTEYNSGGISCTLGSGDLYARVDGATVLGEQGSAGVADWNKVTTSAPLTALSENINPDYSRSIFAFDPSKASTTEDMLKQGLKTESTRTIEDFLDTYTVAISREASKAKRVADITDKKQIEALYNIATDNDCEFAQGVAGKASEVRIYDMGNFDLAVAYDREGNALPFSFYLDKVDETGIGLSDADFTRNELYGLDLNLLADHEIQ